MATYAFSGGSAPVKGAGQKNKIRFGGTWAAGDEWTVSFTSQLSGEFTLGKGNIAGKNYLSCLTFKDRVILGYSGGFAISAVDDPTGWEEQNIGAAVFPFSNTYGISDSVAGIGTTTGRLYAFGQATIQSWNTDADPSKWTLQQVIDNAGTPFGGSIQSVGEIDIYYVDRTGARSIQTKELTGDAFVGDIGTPVDSLVSAAVLSVTDTPEEVCSAIMPGSKNYLVWIPSSFYNFAKFPISKIEAWTTYTADYSDLAAVINGAGVFNGSGQSTYTVTAGVVYAWVRPTNSTSTTLVNGTETLNYETHFTAQGTSVVLNGTVGASVLDSLVPIRTFTPSKMAVAGSSLYVYGTDNWVYRVFSREENEFTENDYSKAVVVTPWLEIAGGKMAQLEAIELVCSGRWAVLVATNPASPVDVLATSTPFSSNAGVSSTVSYRRFAISGNTSRVRLTFISIATTSYLSGKPPRLCSAAVIYKPSNEK